MADIVDELRASAPPGRHVGDCMVRAADEIERLRSELNFRREIAHQTERMRADAFSRAFPNGFPFQLR